MSIHPKMRAMAIRLLSLQPKGQGSPASLIQRIGGYDPTTGEETPITLEQYETSAVRVNYSEYAYKNSTILFGDFQLYVCPIQTNGLDTPTPQVGNIISFLGQECEVINVAPFNDNGLGCGWKLQVRYG